MEGSLSNGATSKSISTPLAPHPTGADLTSSVVDRVDFDGANLTGTKFTNAVITGGARRAAIERTTACA